MSDPNQMPSGVDRQAVVDAHSTADNIQIKHEKPVESTLFVDCGVLVKQEGEGTETCHNVYDSLFDVNNYETRSERANAEIHHQRDCNVDTATITDLCFEDVSPGNMKTYIKMENPGAGSTPPDFLAALYGEYSGDEGPVDPLFEEDSGDEGVDEEFALSDEENDFSSPTPPAYSPITRHASPEMERGVVLGIFSEDGTPLEDFLAPDSHALFESAVRLSFEREFESEFESSVERGNSRGRSLRGRMRGGRGGRVRNRGQCRGRGGQRRRHHGWQPGQPLEEIWMTDDDVPRELREMVRDVIRRRQARLEGTEERRRARASEPLNERHNSESENDDVFEDAIDGRSNSLLKGVDLHFEWSPMETFRNVEETFVPERTGSVSHYTNPYDAFRSFWDDNILQEIVTETNRYASRIQSASFQADWFPINVHELLCLFAFWMMTGIIRMPTIRSYFSTNSLLKTEIFSRITTLKRYNNLNRALHFVDTSLIDPANPTNSDAASSDSLHRLKPIIDHLNSKFQSNYVLSKDICIDESLTLWKGRLKFKQYIRSKAAKFGIKTFELCESATGYLWSFLVYTGKQDAVEVGIAKSTALVLKLIQPLLNKGYRLFMDNWFNSPLLARILKRNGTDCVGTLRASREDFPRLLTHAPLKQGQLVARHSGDVCVLSWMDKNRINMISTCHGSATGLPHVSSRPTARPELFKPQSVLDYNRAMGGVDLKDQMLEPYLLERKRCAKWYMKLFKRLLNCSIHNSRVLLESSLQARQDNFKFRLELVHAILSYHHSLIPVGRRAESSQSRTAHISHIVHHTHWPVRLPQTETDQATNRQSRRRCVVCLREGRKSQKTCFKCEDCSVPLCVENCFKKYHTSV